MDANGHQNQGLGLHGLCHDKEGEGEMKRPTCETCIYWINDPDNPYGICTRFPKIEIKKEFNFCGEHPDFASYFESVRGYPNAEE